MKQNVRSGSVAVLALLAVCTMAGALGGGGKTIAWQSDLAKAQKAAAKQHKIVMVDFYADW